MFLLLFLSLFVCFCYQGYSEGSRQLFMSEGGTHWDNRLHFEELHPDIGIFIIFIRFALRKVPKLI